MIIFFSFLFFVGCAFIFYAVHINAKAQKKAETEDVTLLRKKFKNLMVVGFILFAVSGIAILVEELKPDPDAWKTRDNSSMAYAMMQGFVKEHLVSPSSAKFEWITEPQCVIVKEGFDYNIRSWVDSQNAFGAMIRTRFSGVVRQVDEKNWQLMELEFDE